MEEKRAELENILMKWFRLRQSEVVKLSIESTKGT